MAQFISRCRQEKLGSNLTNRITQQCDVRIESKLSELSKKGRTAKLWMTYHTLILKTLSLQKESIITIYTWHLATVVDMLPIFAAAGHTQYAKGARLYVQMMPRNITTYTSAKNIFQVHKLHTVRYNKFEWSGIWTDLSIEQTLMRAMTSRGGLTGGKMRNQKLAYKVWVRKYLYQSGKIDNYGFN